MSILHVPSAAGKGLAPGALSLAILVALTVNVYPRWSPNYLPPIGLLRRAALFTAFPLAWAGILGPGPASWMHGVLAAHLDNAGRLSGSCMRRPACTSTAGRKPYGLASVAHPGGAGPP